MNGSSYRCVVSLLKMFSNIVAVHFISEGIQNTERKPLISCKSQANYHRVVASTPCLMWDHNVMSSDFSWQTSNFQTL